MNKILNINLGGYALTIDDDAYEHLQAYLESIRRRFSESEGRDEIVNDIEARIGELIHEGMGSRTIVMLPDVEAAVQVMGKPEEFGGEPAEPTNSSGGKGSSGGSGWKPGQSSFRTGKRLFRDEEDAVAGGVCSGLSAYFGIQDPVWLRLAFVVLAFPTFGFWPFAYLLLWILVPPAKSAADRLSMRGEPINADNIAREIEEGFERLSTKVKEAGGKAGAQSTVTTGLSVIGQVFAFAVRLFVKFWVVIALLIAVALFVGLLGGWMGGIWGLVSLGPYIGYVSPLSSAGNWVGFANLFFILGIPVIGLCLMFTRILLKVRIPRWLGGMLTVFWFINLFSAFTLLAKASGDYRRSGTLNKTIDLSSIQSDTLRIGSATLWPDSDEEEDIHWSFGWFRERNLHFNGDQLELNGPVEIRVRRSTSGRFECIQNITARGATRNDALQYASQTPYSITTDGNLLRIPTSYTIEKGSRWRVQMIKIIIGVPDGKSIIFDKNIYSYGGAEMDEYADRDGNYISRRPDQMFRMTRDGLVCTDCPNLGDQHYEGDDDFDNFILEGDFETEIRKGDRFKVEIGGPKGIIQTIRTGDKITFTTNGKPSGGATRVFIQAPTFTSLHCENGGNVVIRGFDEGEASISMRGASQARAYLDASNLHLALSGKCTLELTGHGNELEANLNNGATLEAGNWRANNAAVSASEASKAHIYVSENVSSNADPSSQVKVDGRARNKN